MSNPQPAPPAKKSSGMLFAIIGVVIGLGGGGGAYYVYAKKFAPPPAAVVAPPPKIAVIPLEPFVVNLADQDATRFLRVTLSLAIEGGEERAKEIGEDAVVKAKIRSAILERLAQETSDQLVTPEGKAALKKVIAEEAAHAAHELKVTDVLFSEFVVQF